MKSLFVASILIFTAIACYSQEPVKATPAEIRANAQKALRETPHRISTTVEMRDTADSDWQVYSSHVKEVVGRDRWHWVSQRGTSRRELIGVGGRTFEKMTDGTWRLQPPAETFTGSTIRGIGKPVIETTVNEKKDGGSVIETSGQSTIQIIRTGEIVDNDRKMKERYDAGRLMRVETEHFNFERKKFQRVIEIYEYDPTIRIAEPIVDK